MTKRTIAIARLTGLAAWIGGSAAAMPQMGQVSIAPGIGAVLVSNQDIKDFYGPGLTANSSPVAASIGAGIDYNVSDSFQLGARFDRILKKYAIDVAFGNSGLTAVDTWQVDANALLLHGRFLLRGRKPATWFAISLLAGQYALTGASRERAFSTGKTSVVDFAGKTTGGEVDLEMEHAFGVQVTGVFMVGWRVAAVSKVTYTTSGSSGTLLNDDGSDATLDLGGLNAGAGLRFYFGGQDSTVTSQ